MLFEKWRLDEEGGNIRTDAVRRSQSVTRGGRSRSASSRTSRTSPPTIRRMHGS
ncbi:hypothetical protein [Methanoculleus chikugoensis]|uniref:hypothetical protein n=1 Tax=Methanoculleus chikugoensis TaxID=118126 RepID=UPI001FB50A8C|nr:hypothetical protein [Methanoculleus chikugoensis]